MRERERETEREREREGERERERGEGGRVSIVGKSVRYMFALYRCHLEGKF